MQQCAPCRGNGWRSLKREGFPAPPCAHLTENPCTTCAQITEVDQDIGVHLQAIEALYRRRDNLAAHLNEQHDPFTRLLPPEVASHIFQLCEPRVYNQNDFKNRMRFISRALNLSSVSKRWRTIAQSTPRLWNNIAVIVNDRKKPLALSLLREWLGRSGQLPLCLEFHVRGDTRKYKPGDVFLNAVARLFLDCVHRWKTLVLAFPFPMRSLFSSHLPTDRNLPVEVFYLSTDEENPTIFDLGPLSPCRFSLRGMDASSLRIGWERMVHCTLDDASTSDVTHVLARCPHLEIMRIRGSLKYRDSEAPTSQEHSLQELFLDVTDDSHPYFWDKLSLPALRRLSCGNVLSDSDSWDLVRKMLITSASPLVELRMFSSRQRESPNGLLELLETVPALETLVMDKVLLEDDFFQRLNQPTAENGTFLLRLRKLEYTITFPHIRHFEAHCLPLIASAQSSGPPAVRPLQIIRLGYRGVDSSDNAGQLIGRDALEKVLGMREAGMDLTIYDDFMEDVIESSRKIYTNS